MIELKDKSKKDFFSWLRNSEYGNSNYCEGYCGINEKVEEFKYVTLIIQNALLIEWLDSKEIFVSIHYETMSNYYFNAMVTNKHLTTNLRLRSQTRNEAISEAIQQALEIYNFRTNE